MPYRAFIPIVFLVFLACLLFPGCGTTPEQRLNMAQAWLSTGEGWSKSFDDAIAACQLILDDVSEKLSDPNLPPAEAARIKEVADQARGQMQAFQAQKAKLDADLATLRARLAQAQEKGATIGNEMEFYSQGLQVLGQRVGGNIGGYITLAALLIGAVGGAFGGGYVKGQQLRAVLGNVVTSVSALLATPTVTNRDTATALLEAGQSPETRIEVRKLLGKS